MEMEKLERIRKAQRLHIILGSISFAVFVTIGILLFVLEKHCFFDVPIYIAYAAVVAVGGALILAGELRIRKKRRQLEEKTRS